MIPEQAEPCHYCTAPMVDGPCPGGMEQVGEEICHDCADHLRDDCHRPLRACDCPSVRAHVLTDAPAAYDYDYVVEVATGIAYDRTTVRRVSIPRAHLAYQAARYQSGLYIAVEVAR